MWLAATAGGLALTAMPASAIVNGTQDTANQFNSSGLVVLGDGTHWCSGALYRTSSAQKSSVMFMTAAHCTFGYDFTGAKVTFDPAGDTNPNAAYIPVVAKYTISSYATAAKSSNSLQSNATADAAVLILQNAPQGITPADLPSVRLVDTLDFTSQLITAVGYGATATGKNLTFGPRFYKTTGITPGQRTQTSDLYLKADASACFGDSGGPNFLYGTSTIIGVTVWGQSVVCSDHNYSYRIDSTEALSFLTDPAATGVTN
jgi:hypothetical protein